jgi:mRNA interferase MazF
VKRGDLYRVKRLNTPDNDPRAYRVYVLVSRQVLIDSQHATVICVSVYTRYNGLSTQVEIGVDEGLKYSSSIHCDDLVSLPKSVLTNYIGKLSKTSLMQLNKALGIALEIELL